MVRFASQGSPVLLFVGLVLHPISPSQIFQIAVERVPIKVPDQSDAVGNKGPCDLAVDTKRLSFRPRTGIERRVSLDFEQADWFPISPHIPTV
jgi:hypothetical protein